MVKKYSVKRKNNKIKKQSKKIKKNLKRVYKGGSWFNKIFSKKPKPKPNSEKCTLNINIPQFCKSIINTDTDTILKELADLISNEMSLSNSKRISKNPKNDLDKKLFDYMKNLGIISTKDDICYINSVIYIKNLIGQPIHDHIDPKSHTSHLHQQHPAIYNNTKLQQPTYNLKPTSQLPQQPSTIYNNNNFV